jgi:hypothetical protein
MLWNYWHLEEALSSGANPWHSNAVVAPTGINLVQHNLVPWPGLLAYGFRLLGSTLVESYNLTLWVGLWLNAMSMYVLAYVLRREWFPALMAGVLFAFAPFFAGRMLGHMGLVHAYPLALLHLCLTRLRSTRSAGWALSVGICVAWSAYCHSYYGVYGAFLVIALFAHDSLRIRPTLQRRSTDRRRLFRVLLATGLLGLAVAIAIAISGTDEVWLLGQRISLRNTKNAMFLWWLSWLAALSLRYRFSVRMEKKPEGLLYRLPAMSWCFLLLPGLILLPLIANVVRLIVAGEFAAQSAPINGGLGGAYPVAVFFPNPYHALWGEPFSRWFSSWYLFEMGSIGLTWTALATVLAKRSYRPAGWWKFSFLPGLLLSLGPLLKFIPGFEHGPALPFYVLRYIPIVSGARVPSRWIAPALVAWCVLFTLALCGIRSWRWRVVLMATLIMECWVAPLRTMSEARIPEIFDRIAEDREPGSVLYLPFGISDARKTWGELFPGEWMYYQVSHRRPIVGGYLGRIPDRDFRTYQNTPLLRSLGELQSEGEADASLSPQGVLADLRELGVRWVLLDTARGSAELRDAMRETLGPSALEEDRWIGWRLPSPPSDSDARASP